MDKKVIDNMQLKLHYIEQCLRQRALEVYHSNNGKKGEFNYISNTIDKIVDIENRLHFISENYIEGRE